MLQARQTKLFSVLYCTYTTLKLQDQRSRQCFKRPSFALLGDRFVTLTRASYGFVSVRGILFSSTILSCLGVLEAGDSLSNLSVGGREKRRESRAASGDMAPFPYLPMVAIMASLLSLLIAEMGVFSYAGYMVEYLGVVDNKDQAGEIINYCRLTSFSDHLRLVLVLLFLKGVSG